MSEIMRDVMREQGMDGQMTEKERLERDRLLLDKERELLRRQASEIRAEHMKIHGESDARDRKVLAGAIKRARYSVQDFVDPKDPDGYSRLLRDAMSFCETRDGCPYYVDGCENDRSGACHGLWIRMGATCKTFAANIKQVMRSLAGHEK